MLKNCPVCSKSYKTYPSIDKKFCSRECLYEQKRADKERLYSKVCKVCGMAFMPPRAKEGGIYCSYKCRGLDYRLDRVDRNGYWYVRMPEHQNANAQGYIPVHHLVMESIIGRPLNRGEVVHHINHNKKDNSVDNLEVMSDSQHRSLHMHDNHNKGKVNTPEQIARTKERMTGNKIHEKAQRGSNGKFIEAL